MDFNKKIYTLLLVSVGTVLCLATSASSVMAAGTNDGVIIPTSYAWSNNDGWINWNAATSSYAVRVTDTFLSGYIWDSRTGWINLAPDSTTYVTNDGYGHLGGYAWGQGVGWINFSGATIDSSGQFHGTFTNDAIGTATFDCSSCGVSTDWRPRDVMAGPGRGAMVIVGNTTASAPTSQPIPATQTIPINSDSTSTQLSNVSSTILNTVPTIPVIIPHTQIPTVSGLPNTPPPTNIQSGVITLTKPDGSATLSTCTIVHNDRMTLNPTQCGQMTQTLPGIGSVTVEVPAHATSTNVVFQIVANTSQGVKKGNQLGTLFDVSAYERTSKKLVHTFATYIKITLPLPKNLIGHTRLRVLTKEQTSEPWNTIPNPIIGTSTITFYVNHLSLFLVEEDSTTPGTTTSNEESNIQSQTIEDMSTSSLLDFYTQRSVAWLGNSWALVLIVIIMLLCIVGVASFITRRLRARK